MLVALILCWLLARITEQPLADVFSALSLWNQHFPPFQAGLVHMRDVAYYLAAHLRGALRRPRGCSKRGGGDEPPWKQSRR